MFNISVQFPSCHQDGFLDEFHTLWVFKSGKSDLMVCLPYEIWLIIACAALNDIANCKLPSTCAKITSRLAIHFMSGKKTLWTKSWPVLFICVNFHANEWNSKQRGKMELLSCDLWRLFIQVSTAVFPCQEVKLRVYFNPLIDISTKLLQEDKHVKKKRETWGDR